MADLSRANQNVQFPPLRSLQDFCLDSARFQFSATDQKWSNRIINNLLYYQTNYFAVLSSLMVLNCFLYPSEFLLGLVGIVCASGSVALGMSQHPTVRKVREQYPWALLIGLCLLVYLIITKFIHVAFFLFPFLVSVLLIFIHASLRTRNLKNRISNKVEELGITTTPMGMLIEMAGGGKQNRSPGKTELQSGIKKIRSFIDR